MKRRLLGAARVKLPETRSGTKNGVGAPSHKAGLTFCRKCGAVYYKKSWHHNLRYYKKLRETLPVNFSLCPACQMIKNNQFGGEIAISGLTAKLFSEIENLANSFCRREYLRDPLNRLISVKKSKTGTVIRTTENQTAVRLAKKIKDSFKGATMKISYSPSPSNVAYVKMGFGTGGW